MAQYGSDHLKIIIQEKDLKESILKTIPVPSNLQEVRPMDEFMVQLLIEKRQNVLLHEDEIYGSLETANKEQDSSVSINDLLKFVTQSIILAGQANIALSYHRRLSALDGVMKSTILAKSMLKNKSGITPKRK